MRQTHLGGDRMFVDYAGDTGSVVVDRLTGEIPEAHLLWPLTHVDRVTATDRDYPGTLRAII